MKRSRRSSRVKGIIWSGNVSVPTVLCPLLSTPIKTLI